MTINKAIQIERARVFDKDILYQRIVETGLEGIWIVAPEGQTLFANQRMADLLGCTVEEMMSRPATDFLFAEDEPSRSEEHTSELQSLAYLVCRLLLENT